MLVFFSFLPFFALRSLWTNLDFSKEWHPVSICVQPLRTRKCLPSLEGRKRRAAPDDCWEGRTGWGDCSCTVTDDGKGLSQQYRAPCDHAGCTRLKSLGIFNVSYTCSYPSSRLKYLHRQQTFISRRAPFVSWDSSRALPSFIKLWWWMEGQVRKSWNNMLSPWPGLHGLSKAGH